VRGDRKDSASSSLDRPSCLRAHEHRGPVARSILLAELRSSFRIARLLLLGPSFALPVFPLQELQSPEEDTEPCQQNSKSSSSIPTEYLFHCFHLLSNSFYVSHQSRSGAADASNEERDVLPLSPRRRHALRSQIQGQFLASPGQVSPARTPHANARGATRTSNPLPRGALRTCAWPDQDPACYQIPPSEASLLPQG